jgi:crotonobetainyl-CoA:carnitine CoA-transferase CaiB-like acyl-CoA transferase
MQILQGIRVLDLTDLKGQMCGKLLRDLGMEVIKVEPPQGDPVRQMGPFLDDIPNVEGSLRFAYLNAGKKSLTLDLDQPAGRDMMLRLAENSDVLLESTPPGKLAGMGLDQEVLRSRNPRLVITSITGFGQRGPYASYECPDIVGVAMGGMMYISGDADHPPVKPPETQSFYLACVHAVVGTLRALLEVAGDGRGRNVDISIQEVMATQENLIRTFALDGYSIRRHGSQHEHVAPASIFPTSDGFVFLFVSKQHWAPFLELWEGHPEELRNPKWIPNYVRREHADWLNKHLTDFTTSLTTAELVERAQSLGVPCLPVNTLTQFREERQVKVRNLFLPTDHPMLGRYEQVALPALLDGSRPSVAPPPLLGQHTAPLIAELEELHSPRTSVPSAPSTGSAGNASPLRSIRVLSFTTGVAGPNAGRILAECGAEVLKIESRHGGIDSFRYFTKADDNLDASARFVEANVNVLSVQLNIKHEAGVRLAKELVAQSDVVLDNFRPDVLPRLGLGASELLAVKPDLIVVKMAAMGASGPDSNYGSWGSTLAAFSGFTHLWNHPGYPRPVGSQGVYPDYLAAAMAPVFVLAALLRRQQTGVGLAIDMAQMEAAAYVLGVSHLDACVNHRDPAPAGNRVSNAAPHDCYPCLGDDRWCVISINTDHQWRRLCEVIERQDLSSRYAGLAERLGNREAIDAILGGWTSQREAHQVLRLLQDHGVPCGVVQSGEDLFNDPHLRANGFISGVKHPNLGYVPMSASPLHVSDVPAVAPQWLAMLGQCNEYVFCDVLGYSRAQLNAWKEAGVVS